MARVFAYIVHKSGIADDTAAELAAAARLIEPAQPPVAIVAGAGPELDAVCASVAGFYGEIWKIADAALSHPNAELVRQALAKLVPRGSIVLVPHQHFGIDLAPGLAIKLNAACAADAIAVAAADARALTVVRQEFGGQFHTHVRCDLSCGAVITVRPGAFKPVPASAPGTVVDRSADVGALTAKRRYLETIVAAAGDVDITREPVLVSVGRGIQEKDNIALAEELAEALGAVVSCSRPVADAKWLDKSRQVGTSGKTVKPKVYLACGISGSFQHLAGIKGNACLIAINKNPNAPIFQAAEIGIVDDILEFLPVLAAKVTELRGVGAKGGRP
jgi:electron transfer flavoprotein alpha subunit